MRNEMKEKGVSESIGYMILLGIVFASIGLVTLYGYPVLLKQQSLANTKNMEQAMIYIQNDIKSLTYTMDLFKETDFQIGSGGPLTVYPAGIQPQSINISVGGATPIATGPISLGEMRYHSISDDSNVAYENGMVVEKYFGQGARGLAIPRWYWVKNVNPAYPNSSALVINLVKLVSGTNNLTSTTGTATIRSQYVTTTVYSTTVGGAQTTPQALSNSIYVTYNADTNSTVYPCGYGDAWRIYLTNPSGLNLYNSTPICPSGKGVYTVPSSMWVGGVSSVIVKVYTIDVEM